MIGYHKLVGNNEIFLGPGRVYQNKIHIGCKDHIYFLLPNRLGLSLILFIELMFVLG